MLHLAIAAGLVLGLIVGLGAAATGNEWLLAIAKGSAPFGAIFMNAIRMVVIPLIVTIIFTSIARLGDPRKLGRIGGLTIAYYWITLVPAIAIGMATMKVGLQYASEIDMPQTAATTVPALQGIVDFIVSLVPANPFAAASNGAILPLIVFTALVAAATGTLAAERRERMINIADDASKALIKLVWWIMYVAPIGVFGLAAPVTAQLGWDLVQSLGVFIISVARSVACPLRCRQRAPLPRYLSRLRRPRGTSRCRLPLQICSCRSVRRCTGQGAHCFRAPRSSSWPTCTMCRYQLLQLVRRCLLHFSYR